MEKETNRRKPACSILASWLKADATQRCLHINRHQNVLWFNRESFEQLVWWTLLVTAIEISADPRRSPAEAARQIVAYYQIVKDLQRAEAESDYQVENLLEAAQG